MFESATLPHELSKEDFEKIEMRLREELLDAQFELAEAKKKAIMILVNGSDGAGKGELLDRLYQWLDSHYLDTLSYGKPTDEERLRPFTWRYWRDMPSHGRIGIVLGSWYHPIIKARAQDQIDDAAFKAYLARVNEFETMLAAEGVLLLKIWLVVPVKEAQARLRKAESADGTLKRRMVIEWADIDTKKERQRLLEAGLEMAETTSTGHAPWFVIPGDNGRYRDVMVGNLLLKAMQRANAGNGVPAPKTSLVQGDPLIKAPTVISALDLDQTIADDDYRKELKEHQRALTRITTDKSFRKRGLVLVFEGNDAAGKGGAILRIREALDPRMFRVHGIAAPTDEERVHPYLWRFWRRIPMRGRIAIFDRSWYGRVLVERVEGFCSESDWLRAYDEINDFERELHDANYTVLKFWLAISKDEQMQRFQSREDTPVKRYKITPEDWRNRDKWELYEQAVNDMVDRTSTSRAPWTLVEANDKHFARVKVLRTIVEALEA